MNPLEWAAAALAVAVVALDIATDLLLKQLGQ
jgi:hypothetical protein